MGNPAAVEVAFLNLHEFVVDVARALLYFAVTALEDSRQPLVAARKVTLGQEQHSQVKTLAGLRPGDRVRIRILSEL